MRSEQTLLPDWRLRSSGSRVRFPVRTTRLMLVAAMVGRRSFRQFDSLLCESTAGSGGTGRNRRFLRTIVTGPPQAVVKRAQSPLRYPLPSGATWASGLARARRASHRESAAREVFQQWQSSAAGPRAGGIARPEAAAAA